MFLATAQVQINTVKCISSLTLNLMSLALSFSACVLSACNGLY